MEGGLTFPDSGLRPIVQRREGGWSVGLSRLETRQRTERQRLMAKRTAFCKLQMTAFETKRTLRRPFDRGHVAV